MPSAAFRFDAELHEYFDLERGDVVPHITGMLEAAGLVDARWYTDESRRRGTEVHKLAAQYDLGALDARRCESPYRGFLLAYVEAMKTIRPKWQKVEEASVHPVYRFAGCPDRSGRIYSAVSVCELKSGPPEPAHGIQTALQAILEADDYNLTPEMMDRYAIYLKPSGRWSLERFTERGDFDIARRIIRRCCS